MLSSDSEGAVKVPSSASLKRKRWARLVGITGIGQILIQGLGFVGGIFIIRILSTEQYAFYTLVNTMLGTMTVLADGGISAGVMALGGENWKDKGKLGSILATGMKMRREFAIFSLLISIPILYYLLYRQGVSWQQSSLLVLCLTPAFWAALSGSLLEVVPKLHQDIHELLKIKLSINVIRLLLLPALFLFPFAGVAILAGGFAQVKGNLQLRKLSGHNATWQQSSSPVYRKKIFGTVKRIFPTSLYYCFSGQITIWLLTIFGTTENIAQIGALSRLVMVLMVLRMCFNMLITPRFARLPKRRKTIILRFFQSLGIMAMICLPIVAFVYLFPNLFLLLLGKKYMNLEYELFLITISSCLVTISSIMNSLTASRNIIPNPYLFISTIVLVQALTLYFFIDYSSLVGVITFSIITALTTITFRTIDFGYQTARKVNWDS